MFMDYELLNRREHNTLKLHDNLFSHSSLTPMEAPNSCPVQPSQILEMGMGTTRIRFNAISVVSRRIVARSSTLFLQLGRPGDILVPDLVFGLRG